MRRLLVSVLGLSVSLVALAVSPVESFASTSCNLGIVPVCVNGDGCSINGQNEAYEECVLIAFQADGCIADFPEECAAGSGGACWSGEDEWSCTFTNDGR